MASMDLFLKTAADMDYVALVCGSRLRSFKSCIFVIVYILVA